MDHIAFIKSKHVDILTIKGVQVVQGKKPPLPSLKLKDITNLQIWKIIMWRIAQ